MKDDKDFIYYSVPGGCLLSVQYVLLGALGLGLIGGLFKLLGDINQPGIVAMIIGVPFVIALFILVWLWPIGLYLLLRFHWKYDIKEALLKTLLIAAIATAAFEAINYPVSMKIEKIKLAEQFDRGEANRQFIRTQTLLGRTRLNILEHRWWVKQREAIDDRAERIGEHINEILFFSGQPFDRLTYRFFILAEHALGEPYKEPLVRPKYHVDETIK